MLFKRLVAAAASLAAVKRDEDPEDLGSILAGHKNLTKYYSLIKVRPGYCNWARVEADMQHRNTPTFCFNCPATAALR